MALVDEMADSEGIRVSVSAGKALVGHVEEGKVTLLLHDGGNLLPLLSGRIDAGGVVSTSVQEEDASLGGGLDVSNHALKVEADSIFVVVAVLLNLEARVTENGLVVGPRRSRDVDLLVSGEKSLDERGANAESSGTRN